MSASVFDERVILRLGGQDWHGWLSVELERQIDALCGTFSLGLTDRVKPGQSPLPIKPGMECQILSAPKDSPEQADGIIQGYIDSKNSSITNSAYSLSISGRDKSADLVDCSAVHSPGEWHGQNILQLAQTLAAPFGVSVSAQGNNGDSSDLGPAFSVFKLEQGETAFDALNRALKQRELFMFPNGEGGLIIAKIGAKTCDTGLILGENLLEFSHSIDTKEVFSQYLVKGQQPGTDDEFGEAASAVSAESYDETVNRYRPLIIKAENQVNASTAAKRAAWEKTVRAGRSQSYEATVQGWRQANGELWPINALVPVYVPQYELDCELLISKVRFSQSRQSGTITRLTLCHQDSFTPEPEDKKQKAQQKGGSDGWENMDEGGGDDDE